nr:AAA family ATPase [uncultured Ruminococcus sp.]
MDFKYTFETERIILGCLASYHELFSDYIPQMSANLFADAHHRDIFNAIQKAYRQTPQYDIQLISAYLSHPSESKVELYRCGDVAFKSTPFEEHYKILAEAARERFIHDQLMNTLSEGEATADRLREIADDADKTYSIDNRKRRYTRLSSVESTTTDWLWYPYIPRGKITLMTADPGIGKTFLSLYLAAQVATGRPFYGETTGRAPAVAVYQTAEDGISDTIKPRLECMQPNFDNIFVYNESEKGLSLTDDSTIEQIMKDLNPLLMIFDPLQAYLGAQIDMNRANQVRPVLGRIGALAEKYNCAIIFIMHHSKDSRNAALYRALGSMDIPAVARSMLILGKDPDPEKPQGIIICHEKSSLGEHGKSIKFEIAPQLGGVVFGGYSDLKADDILNAPKATRNKPSKKRDALIDDILDLFDGKDYIRIPKLKDLCEKLECSQNTLYRARDELGIQSLFKGYGEDKVTYWLMPDVDRDSFSEKLCPEKMSTEQVKEAE